MTKSRKKKKHRTECQHYVSQFYLRGFANTEGKLHCFDKVTEKSFITSTKAAAQESYFYEILPGSFKDTEVPVNTVENALASIERMWAPKHAELIDVAKSGKIPENLRREYAPFVVIQWMRTKTYREMIHAVMQMTMQSMADELKDLNFPDKKVKLTANVDKKQLSALHAQKLFDLDEVAVMAHDLLQHLWSIGLNNTDDSLYTSDHPVVRRANRKFDGKPMVGINDPGIEFVFPLDSRHVLIIHEREHFFGWARHENRSVELSPAQVRDYNSLQTLKSNQRIYCCRDEFDVAREVCTTQPEIRNPNRPRFLVETTPIKNMKSYTFVTALE